MEYVHQCKQRMFVIIFLSILSNYNLPCLQYFTDYKLTYKSENGTQNVPSVYKEYFLSYLGFAAQVPNVLFNLLNIFFQFGYV